MTLLYTPAFVLSVLLPVGPPSPEELIARAIESRRRHATAQFEWVLSKNDGEKYYTSRIAGEDQLTINRGNRDGVMFPNQLGQDYACSSIGLLLKDGQQWRYLQGEPAVRVTSNTANFYPAPDVRAAGLFPTPAARWSSTGSLDVPIESFDETREADTTVVTGFLQGGSAIKWWFDEMKGGQPVRCALLNGDSVIAECRTDYLEYDGVWFPSRVEYFAGGSPSGSLSVLSASFDEPSHAQNLSPADLGVVPGINVFYPPEEVPEPNTWYHWDGAGVVDSDTIRQRIKRGEVDKSQFDALLKRIRDGEGIGRHPQKWDAEDLGLGAGLSRKPGLWEEYVRRFIQKRRLNTDRARKAWGSFARPRRRRIAISTSTETNSGTSKRSWPRPRPVNQSSNKRQSPPPSESTRSFAHRLRKCSNRSSNHLWSV